MATQRMKLRAWRLRNQMDTPPTRCRAQNDRPSRRSLSKDPVAFVRGVLVSERGGLGCMTSSTHASAMVAPVAADQVSPECRRSWNLRSSRCTAERALDHAALNALFVAGTRSESGSSSRRVTQGESPVVRVCEAEWQLFAVQLGSSAP